MRSASCARAPPSSASTPSMTSGTSRPPCTRRYRAQRCGRRRSHSARAAFCPRARNQQWGAPPRAQQHRQPRPTGPGQRLRPLSAVCRCAVCAPDPLLLRHPPTGRAQEMRTVFMINCGATSFIRQLLEEDGVSVDSMGRQRRAGVGGGAVACGRCHSKRRGSPRRPSARARNSGGGSVGTHDHNGRACRVPPPHGRSAAPRPAGQRGQCAFCGRRQPPAHRHPL